MTHRVGEGGQDPLVGRMARRGRLRNRFGDERFLGETEQGLTGDPQVVALFVEFAQVRGQFLDPGPGLFGPLAEHALARVDLPQDGPRRGLSVMRRARWEWCCRSADELSHPSSPSTRVTPRWRDGGAGQADAASGGAGGGASGAEPHALPVQPVLPRRRRVPALPGPRPRADSRHQWLIPPTGRPDVSKLRAAAVGPASHSSIYEPALIYPVSAVPHQDATPRTADFEWPEVSRLRLHHLCAQYVPRSANHQVRGEWGLVTTSAKHEK